MADERRHRERDEVQRNREPQRNACVRDHQHHERQDQERHEPIGDRARRRRARAERDDERQEIERQRRDPEERHRRDVGREVRRDGEHQARRNERERDPRETALPVERRPSDRLTASVVTRGCRHRPRGAPPPGGDRDARQEHEHRVADRPDPTLHAQRERRLDRDRIHQQREQAPEIARGVEEVRILRGRMIGLGEPALKHGRRRRQREERQTDRPGEQQEQPADRIAIDGRRRVGTNRERQRQRRQQQHADVHDARSPRPQPLRDAVRVRVAAEQHDLEEQHARVPDHRRPAENRQNALRDHRLDDEHQQRAEEQRRREREDEGRLPALRQIW